VIDANETVFIKILRKLGANPTKLVKYNTYNKFDSSVMWKYSYNFINDARLIRT
jgi:hypothetical protein